MPLLLIQTFILNKAEFVSLLPIAKRGVYGYWSVRQRSIEQPDGSVIYVGDGTFVAMIDECSVELQVEGQELISIYTSNISLVRIKTHLLSQLIDDMNLTQPLEDRRRKVTAVNYFDLRNRKMVMKNDIPNLIPVYELTNMSKTIIDVYALSIQYRFNKLCLMQNIGTSRKPYFVTIVGYRPIFRSFDENQVTKRDPLPSVSAYWRHFKSVPFADAISFIKTGLDRDQRENNEKMKEWIAGTIKDRASMLNLKSSTFEIISQSYEILPESNDRIMENLENDDDYRDLMNFGAADLEQMSFQNVDTEDLELIMGSMNIIDDDIERGKQEAMKYLDEEKISINSNIASIHPFWDLFIDACIDDMTAKKLGDIIFGSFVVSVEDGYNFLVQIFNVNKRIPKKSRVSQALALEVLKTDVLPTDDDSEWLEEEGEKIEEEIKRKDGKMEETEDDD
jgi:hypothetical protein